MKYEKKNFWWGFAGGASTAYAFIFLVIFAISIVANLPMTNISLLLTAASGIFALLIIFGRVRDASNGRLRRRL